MMMNYTGVRRVSSTRLWSPLPGVLCLLGFCLQLQAQAQGAGAAPPGGSSGGGHASQTASTDRPSFEVASIKLDPSCKGRERGVRPSAGRLSMSCVPLRSLIRTAFGGFVNGSMRPTRLDVVGGPGWVDSDLYDIEAKANDAVPPDQIYGSMLQLLLEERFKLSVHKESRDDLVYVLTVAKSGPKLKPAKDGDCTPLDLNHLPGRPEAGQPLPHYCGIATGKASAAGMVYDGYGMTMADFAGRILAGNVDRPVMDKTGLTGKFDIHLVFVPNLPPPGPVRLNGVDIPSLPPPTSDDTGLSVFAAVERQLGMKLSPDKGPTDFFVITHVEKPSEN